ncbi:MAG: DUF3089 domain-containing protein [bacterium]|nr:DUF3089 domain-containing protein [bacterium]
MRNSFRRKEKSWSDPGETLRRTLRPAYTFAGTPPPPAPDYRSPDAWAALPWRSDDADLAPPNTRYPEAQATAAADVFFIHPTGYQKAASWNGPVDDPDAAGAVSLVMQYLAGAFNAGARVYAPRYRQATLYAFLERETRSGVEALDLAFSDVARAFDLYIAEYNRGRPFILAGHSQGSIHGLRLLQERIVGAPVRERLVAAYLVGMPVPREIPGIPPSRAATDTGGVIGWTSFTRDGDPRFLTRDMTIWFGGAYRKAEGLALVQVNPLSWELNGGEVPASANPGSLPFYGPDGGPPPLVPGVTGADASGHVLIVDRPAVPGFPGAGPEMPILNADFGDYHMYEYVLFYESIRGNVVDRVKAFAGK